MITNAELMKICRDEYWFQIELEGISEMLPFVTPTYQAGYMAAIAFDYVARGDY